MSIPLILISSMATKLVIIIVVCASRANVVYVQAMSIVQDRLNAKKPPPAVTDPKTGKLGTGALNNDKDLDVDLKKDEPGFFGSFFAGTRGAQVKKKGAAAMDSVRYAVFACRIASSSVMNIAAAANSASSCTQRARDYGDGSYQ